MKFLPFLSIATVGATLFLLSTSQAAAEWIAYNDSVDTEPDSTPENATSFGLGRGYQGDGESGELLNFETGEGTGVEIEFVETMSEGNTVNWAGDFADFDEEADAAATFGEIINLTGNMSYNDAPGWHVDLIITGLDPERTYTFEGTANRNGGASYADRVTNWSIRDADASVYASSPGAHKVSDESVEFSTGENRAGYVARWTGIRGGDDGQIVIRTTHGLGEGSGGMAGAHAYKGYAGGGFILREEPAAGGFAWSAFNDSIIVDDQVVSENVTDFGLGRGYGGSGENGELLEVDSGENTGVSVEFVETFSEGNTINAARDSAEFDPESDAGTIFGGYVELAGNMSYNDAPGWYLDLNMSGLDPEKGYTFAGTANRAGGASYADRITNWKIVGADAFAYASSAGAHKVSDDSVEFSTGNNEAGYVAQWSDIRPSDDGKVTIRTSHGIGEANGGMAGAHAYKGYGGGVFMLAEQAGASVTPGNAVDYFRISPAPDAERVHPNAPIEIILEHREAGVDPATVVLTLNGATVTPEVKVGELETVIRILPDGMFASRSEATVTLTFKDTAEPPNTYEREWSFTVENYTDKDLYTAIPSTLALILVAEDASSSDLDFQRGFALRVAAPSFDDDVFVETPEDVEAIWDESFENLADLSDANGLGYFIENGTVNYQTDLEPRGNKAGETAFPGIADSFDPGVAFGVEVKALFLLEPGFHLLNITVPGEFEWFIGSDDKEVQLPRTYVECTNCGGEDGPWVTGVIIEERGLYGFRVLYPNPEGAGSLELLEVAPDGSRHLINADNPRAIAAFVPPGVIPSGLRVLSIERNDNLMLISVETPDASQPHSVETSRTLVPDSWTSVPIEDTQELDDTILQIEFDVPAEPAAYFRVVLDANE